MRNSIKQQAIEAGKKLGLVGVALTAYVNQALAAVPADVTSALADMKTDGLTVAGVFLVATIAITAFLFMRKGAKA